MRRACLPDFATTGRSPQETWRRPEPLPHRLRATETEAGTLRPPFPSDAGVQQEQDPGSPGSARTSTNDWTPSGPVRWATSASPACSSTPPTSRPASTTASSSRRSSSPLGAPPAEGWGSVTQDGGREVVGVVAGDSETEAFWIRFLRHLRERGLSGVRPVISDSHSGLVKAIRKVMPGAARESRSSARLVQPSRSPRRPSGRTAPRRCGDRCRRRSAGRPCPVHLMRVESAGGAGELIVRGGGSRDADVPLPGVHGPAR